jgi:hypothetical protein
VTDNDAPHSGSRWEPHPWDGGRLVVDPTPGQPSSDPAASGGDTSAGGPAGIPGRNGTGELPPGSGDGTADGSTGGNA